MTTTKFTTTMTATIEPMGMTLQAIGWALGVNEKTVRNVFCSLAPARPN
jgi:hypothetical protein